MEFGAAAVIWGLQHLPSYVDYREKWDDAKNVLPSL